METAQWAQQRCIFCCVPTLLAPRCIFMSFLLACIWQHGGERWSASWKRHYGPWLEVTAAAGEQGGGRGESPITYLKEKNGMGQVLQIVPYFSYLAACNLCLCPSLSPSDKQFFIQAPSARRESQTVPPPTTVKQKLHPTIVP